MPQPPDGPVKVDLKDTFNKAAAEPERDKLPKPPALEYRPPMTPSLGGAVHQEVTAKVARRGPATPGEDHRGPQTLRERFNEAARIGRQQEREGDGKGLRERFNAAANEESLRARFNREASLRERFNQSARGRGAIERG